MTGAGAVRSSWPAAFPEPAGDTVDRLRGLAEQLALEAAELIGSAETGPEVTATKSSPTDVVTAMDRAVEALIRDRLAATRPADGVLGEEAGDRIGESGLTWVLDPIDGTVNYLYRIPQYAISIAVVQGNPRHPGGWRPIAGCVHAPETGDSWSAGRGRGAWFGDQELHLSDGPELGQALVGTGFGYRAERRRAQAAVLAELIGQVRDIRRIGSASLDLCSVASGQLDAFYERGLNVWDLAAGALVVTEAGGVVRGLRGAPPTDLMVLAAPPRLAEQLQAALEAARADRPDE